MSGLSGLRRLVSSHTQQIHSQVVPHHPTTSSLDAPFRPSTAPPPSLPLPSDRVGMSQSTRSALGVDAEGALLAIFAESGGGGGGVLNPTSLGDTHVTPHPNRLALVMAAERGEFSALLAMLSGEERAGLVAAGCVNARLGGAGRSALYYAAKAGEEGAVVALLGAGADPKGASAPPSLLTPLHAFAEGGGVGQPPGIVTALCAAGGDVNARDGEFQQTPLHLAALKGGEMVGVGVVAALLACGADKGAKDRFGDTPLDLARDAGGGEELLSLLKL